MNKVLTSGLVFMPLEVFINLDIEDLKRHMKEKVDNEFIEFKMSEWISSAGIDEETGYMCIEYIFWAEQCIKDPNKNIFDGPFNMWNFYKCKEPKR